MAELIKKTDNLNQGREKLNEAIKDAETAKGTSAQADDKATQALEKSESTQTQLDTIVIEGDSSVEAAQARVPVEGEAYPTLKARLDAENAEVTSQMAQTEKSLGESEDATLSELSVWDDLEQRGWNLRWFKHLVPNHSVLADEKDWDWTEALRTAISYAQQKGTPQSSGSQYPDDSYGSKVYIPRGYYSITGNFHIQGSGVEIIGETKFATLLYYKGTELTSDDYIFNLGDGSQRYRNIVMKNLTIRGANDGTRGQYLPRAIRLYDVSSWEIENVDVFFLHQGFHSSRAWVGKMDRCEFKHNYRSLYLDHETHNASIRDCVFGATSKGYNDTAVDAQLTVRNCWSIKIDNCDFEFGINSIYLYNSVRGASVENSYFENNSGYALYIRDDSTKNDGACDGIIFEGNFINQGNGKGVYVRHDNPNGKKHAGIEVRGNYAYIIPNSYFIEDSSTNREVVVNSFFNSNSIAQGSGEHVQNDNSGWNRLENLTTIRTKRKSYSVNSAPRNQNENISLWDFARAPWSSIPTYCRTSRRLISGVSYLATVQLTESDNKMETGLYLLHLKGSSAVIQPILPVTQGTLRIITNGSGDRVLEFAKESGYSTGITLAVIPLTGDTGSTEVF